MLSFLLTSSFLALLSQVVAQDNAQAYPAWVTNDYPCVIKCIEGQLKDARPPASDGQTAGALGCVRDACSKETAPGNEFQAHYIINMFNTIGSIYEPESWQAGNAPDATDLIAPAGWVQTQTTATWIESDQPTTVTTSVWVPPATSSPVVTSSPAANEGPSASATTSATVSSGAVGAGTDLSSSLTTVLVSKTPLPSVSGVANQTNATNNGTDEGNEAGKAVVDSSLGVIFALGAVLAGGLLSGVGLGF